MDKYWNVLCIKIEQVLILLDTKNQYTNYPQYIGEFYTMLIIINWLFWLINIEYQQNKSSLLLLLFYLYIKLLIR